MRLAKVIKRVFLFGCPGLDAWDVVSGCVYGWDGLFQCDCIGVLLDGEELINLVDRMLRER